MLKKMLRHLRRIKKYLHSILDIAGITNYPIGVGINAAGEITIADNHNNFNLSVFSQYGQLISALESKVRKIYKSKHSDQCNIICIL